MIRLTNTRAILAPITRDTATWVSCVLEGRSIDLEKHSAQDIEAAQHVWAARIVDEYRSVEVFADILQCLARCEAPFESLVTMSELIRDELRHVALCARVLELLGGGDSYDIELDELGVPPSDEPPAVRALEIIAREIAVAETESVRVLDAYARASEDELIHAALRAILEDEVRHAAAGRDLTTMLSRELPQETLAPLLARLRRTLENDVEDLRARYDTWARGGPGRALGASITRQDLGHTRSYRWDQMIGV